MKEEEQRQGDVGQGINLWVMLTSAPNALVKELKKENLH
jgi:hypothetical protein